MKKYYVLLFMMVLLMSSSLQVKAQSDTKINGNHITWHVFDAPPLIITQGPSFGSGIVDGLKDLLKENIHNYTHSEQELPYKRFLLYAKQGQNICTPYLYKNDERENYLYFSEPALIYPGVQVIVTKKTFETIGSPLEISVKELFALKGFRLGTNKIRSYGLKLDPLIESFEMSGKVSRHPGSTTLIFKLLTHNRIDFMLDFPNRILYWAQEANLNPSDYRSIPISEGYSHTLSYVACPKTPWGKSVIDQVNDVLTNHVDTENYLHILERWSQSFDKQMVQQLYKVVLLKYYNK